MPSPTIPSASGSSTKSAVVGRPFGVASDARARLAQQNVQISDDDDIEALDLSEFDHYTGNPHHAAYVGLRSPSPTESARGRQAASSRSSVTGKRALSPKTKAFLAQPPPLPPVGMPPATPTSQLQTIAETPNAPRQTRHVAQWSESSQEATGRETKPLRLGDPAKIARPERKSSLQAPAQFASLTTSYSVAPNGLEVEIRGLQPHQTVSIRLTNGANGASGATGTT